MANKIIIYSIVIFIMRTSDDLVEEIFQAQSTDHIRILSLRMNHLTPYSPLFLSKADWSRLTELDLFGNKIRDLGCKFLTRANMRYFRQLVLGQAEIGSEGVLHLSKGNWKHLARIYLSHAILVDGSLCWMAGTKWKNLQSFSIHSLHLTGVEQTHLLIADLFPIRICFKDPSWNFQHPFISEHEFGKMEMRYKEKFSHAKFAKMAIHECHGRNRIQGWICQRN